MGPPDGDRVVEIDRAAEAVRSGCGIVEHHDVLLVTMGPEAFVPPFRSAFMADGRLKPGLFADRTIEDCRGIAEQAEGARAAVAIGGRVWGRCRVDGGFAGAWSDVDGRIGVAASGRSTPRLAVGYGDRRVCERYLPVRRDR